ncbi:hypothetical protein VTK73DRAFT_1766 [Phialemonium thermophilum]|uniref:Uncharacterized protein n=1 Tax=Phialemonium thermophilum TaxID=223376 RepID=A0ABR3VT06_9PEZI
MDSVLVADSTKKKAAQARIAFAPQELRYSNLGYVLHHLANECSLSLSLSLESNLLFPYRHHDSSPSSCRLLGCWTWMKPAGSCPGLLRSRGTGLGVGWAPDCLPAPLSSWW